MNIDAKGSFSDSFKMNEFPAAIAKGNIHNGTIAGKLNGVIPSTTPNGENSLQESIEVLMFLLNSPFRISPIPQAYSTFSIPLLISPIASSWTFPKSLLIICASLSMLFSSKTLYSKSIEALFANEYECHSLNASIELSIVSSIIFFDALVASAIHFPLDGLKISKDFRLLLLPCLQLYVL